ncbi:MAG: hypothetical protein M8349_07405 [ANME-2 cluster archaeon]|nr:hypothetical protein [ANME-2 cluster archaeon]
MNNAEFLELKSKSIDALPIINHFIDRLDIDEILKYAMPHADSSNHIMPHTSIGMLLRNIIIGQALEKLFDTDRASLMTEIVLKAVREFNLEMEQFHNDSTSITFHGNYEGAIGSKIRGQETLKITHGHNKDHRPDLKQLVFDCI